MISACEARDPYVTMCGVGLDLATGRQALTGALATREAGNRDQSGVLLRRARHALAAADGPIEGIEADEVRAEATWISLEAASRHLASAADGIDGGATASIVTQEIGAADDKLAVATKVLPKACVEP